MPASTDLLLIRHAPVARPGRLVGRTDATALIDADAIAALRSTLPEPARVVASPARRCADTAAALFPDRDVTTDERLWEQDFGRFDGVPVADLPDLGPLSPDALAAYRWEGGESFLDVATRTRPAFAELASGPGPVVVVAHAGTIRAALAAALGSPGSPLAFEIATLSVTRLRWHPAGISVAFVNRVAA